MKTSNKLLIGLIAFLFLIPTIFIGTIKFYQLPDDAQMEETSSSYINQMESPSAALLYFPRALLLPLSW